MTMFALKSTCDALRLQAYLANQRYLSLRAEWNALVERINDKGGEDFLRNARIQPAAQFTEDELAKLVMLCHPDKHDGKPMATEMTQRILAIKNAITKCNNNHTGE